MSITVQPARIIYVIRFADGSFAGSPLAVRTTNKNLAGTFRATEKGDAEAAAKALGGEVVVF